MEKTMTMKWMLLLALLLLLPLACAEEEEDEAETAETLDIEIPAGWRAETLTDLDEIRYADLALDQDDAVHIVFGDRSTLRYTNDREGYWYWDRLCEELGELGLYDMKFTVSTTNRPALVYQHEVDTSTALFYLADPLTAWEPEMIVGGIGDGSAQFCLDGQDRPWFAYSESWQVALIEPEAGGWRTWEIATGASPLVACYENGVDSLAAVIVPKMFGDDEPAWASVEGYYLFTRDGDQWRPSLIGERENHVWLKEGRLLALPDGELVLVVVETTNDYPENVNRLVVYSGGPNDWRREELIEYLPGLCFEYGLRAVATDTGDVHVFVGDRDNDFLRIFSRRDGSWQGDAWRGFYGRFALAADGAGYLHMLFVQVARGLGSRLYHLTNRPE